MTFLLPRQVGHVVGHDSGIACFYDAFTSGRLHHAWLISGPEGIGKATLAFYLARILLGGEDPSSPVARRISAGTHADLLHVERHMDVKKGRLRGEITVSDVRPVHHFLHHTATKGGWRVVIVDGMEFLNRFAANALLKILEEPPPKAVLLLTTTLPGALLPTLRSRCRTLPLMPLDEDEMRSLLPDMPANIVQQAHGSPGRAFFLAKDHDGHIATLVQAALNGQKLEMTLWESISRISRESDGFALFCDLLGEGVAQAVRAELQAGRLEHAAHLAHKTSELLTLRRQTEGFSLDKAQAMRQAFALVAEQEAALG